MIKELRLGNKILLLGVDYNHDNKFHDPDGDEIINYSIDLVKEMIDSPESFGPVPLTPEILEKCGFEKYMGVYNLDRSKDVGHHLSDFAVDFYDNTQLRVWRGDRYIGIVSVRYLHQLQNLFYSLTGEELNFHRRTEP